MLVSPAGQSLNGGQVTEPSFSAPFEAPVLAIITKMTEEGLHLQALEIHTNGSATEAAESARTAILALAALLYRRESHDQENPDAKTLYNFILQLACQMFHGDTSGQHTLLMNALKITLLNLKHADGNNWKTGDEILAQEKEGLNKLISKYIITKTGKDVKKYFFYPDHGDNEEYVMVCIAMLSLWKYYVATEKSHDTLPQFCESLLPHQDKVATYQWKTWEFWKAESAHVAHVFLMDLVGLRLIDINKRMDLGLWAPGPVLAVVAMKAVVAFCTDVEHPHPLDGALRLSRGWLPGWLGITQKESSPSLLRELGSVGFLYFTGNNVMAGVAMLKTAIKIWHALKGQPDQKGRNYLNFTKAIMALKNATPEEVEVSTKQLFEATAVVLNGNDSVAKDVPVDATVLGKRSREEDVNDVHQSQGGSSPKRGRTGKS